MEIVKTIEELRYARKQLPNPVGLVPTMGYLHAGHLSLVERARKECSSVVVSIYVNPTQFGPNEDFSSYPRDVERDLSLLREAGVDTVWTPDETVMYPQGYQTYVSVENVTKVLEGAMRPTHFRGVTTIVAKLFNAVQPDKAYFGQKDAQQVAVLQQMVKDLNFNLEMVICPIVREMDGLALSSRNIFLNEAQREAALALSHSLRTARAMFANSERDASTIRSAMHLVFEKEPLARVQYISLADPGTLEDLTQIKSEALVSMAVYFGNTRLIDNTILGREDSTLN